jgi:FdhD protein
MDTRPGSKTAVNVIRVQRGEQSRRSRRDYVVTEEPLEIRIATGGETRQLAVTMRTPGADFELATGFLFGEGLIHSHEDIESIRYCVEAQGEEQLYNVVNVSLRHALPSDLRVVDRHFVVSSSCGLCGKASIDALERRGISKPVGGHQISAEVIADLSSQLRQAQRLFDVTGGLHAVGLFDSRGQLLAMREDVGRHNAMDKLVGWALMQNRIPLTNCIVLVSGRASFELVQKAAAAGVPVFCAISAPSSLAVRMARRFGMTLIGFLRDDQFNLYCGEERISPPTCH